jgi:hypothetical protein
VASFVIIRAAEDEDFEKEAKQKLALMLQEMTKIYSKYSLNASAAGGLRPPDPLPRGFAPGPHRALPSFIAPLPPLFCHPGYGPVVVGVLIV